MKDFIDYEKRVRQFVVRWFSEKDTEHKEKMASELESLLKSEYEIGYLDGYSKPLNIMYNQDKLQPEKR